MSVFEGTEKEYIGLEFDNINACGQVISGIEFEDCSFNSCNFTEVQFRNCKFIDCRFNKCNLSLVKVDHTKFSDVSFYESKLLGVDWTKAYWRGINLHASLSFAECVLNTSSFYGLNLPAMKIENCTVNDVDFREAKLEDGVFVGSDFMGSSFRNTNLTSTDFENSENYNIDILNNTVSKAKFSRYSALSLLEGLDIELV